jgi:hypothetical protein
MGAVFQEAIYKRQFPRRKFDRQVGILFGGDYYLCRGGEIGEGGMSFILGISLPIGGEAVLTFRLPGQAFVTVRAQIKSEQKQGPLTEYGVAFNSLNFEVKRNIRTYVSERDQFE